MYLYNWLKHNNLMHKNSTLNLEGPHRDTNIKTIRVFLFLKKNLGT
jgi:hypothetical protein